MTEANGVDATAITSNVYVFNCYNEPVSALNINGTAGGDIAGWSTTAATKYTPSQLAVPRVKNAGSTFAFNIGENDIRVPWDSFTGTASVVIPPGSEVSLDDDLILFVAKNQVVLLTTRGMVIATFPMKNVGATAAAE